MKENGSCRRQVLMSRQKMQILEMFCAVQPWRGKRENADILPPVSSITSLFCNKQGEKKVKKSVGGLGVKSEYPKF